LIYIDNLHAHHFHTEAEKLLAVAHHLVNKENYQIIKKRVMAITNDGVCFKSWIISSRNYLPDCSGITHNFFCITSG
jgi:hypothetical protein